jgi:endonuclease YncB( thermonuclease family)
MPGVKIFWDPQGFELDQLQDKKYLDATDGDTPYISVSIRMLSIDTPEVHYPMSQKPSRHDAKLKQLADWIKEGKAPIRDGLATYLHPRLETGSAGTLQQQQGEAAEAFFKATVKAKLERPRGGPRRVFVWTADEKFDQYGRLLAYLAPKFTPDELKDLSPRDRATFNYLMVEAGWAASFVIFPSLPKHSDLVMLRDAAQKAFDDKLGAWADPNALTGYEFRMAYKLFEVTEKLAAGKRLSSAERNGWIERFCADMTTREIFYPQDYIKVPVYNRIFLWAEDVTEAVGRLNLVPGD